MRITGHVRQQMRHNVRSQANGIPTRVFVPVQTQRNFNVPMDVVTTIRNTVVVMAYACRVSLFHRMCAHLALSRQALDSAVQAATRCVHLVGPSMRVGACARVELLNAGRQPAQGRYYGGGREG